MSPVIIHPYNASRGLDQLVPYDQILVLVKSNESGQFTMPKSDPDEVYKMLGVPQETIEAEFLPPMLISSYRISRLYRLTRLVPLNRDPSEPVDIPFNMFWFW